MKAIAGAVVVLAGAVLIAAGSVANAITTQMGEPGTLAIVVGVAVGLVGFIILFRGPRPDSEPTPGP